LYHPERLFDTAAVTPPPPEPPDGVTVRLRAVVWVSEPLTPVIVTDEVPTVAVLLAVNVTRLVPVVGLVPKEAVTPVGSVLVLNVTLPAKLFTLFTVTVVALVPPWPTDTVVGLADRVKSGVVDVTLRPTGVV
jgi:hypothetical protein